MTTDSFNQLIASDRIEGTPVRRSNGDKLGSIERLMVDKINGTVAYAVMRFGGFFSLGDEHYPIPWSLLKFNPAINAYELDISQDVLSRAPKMGEGGLDFGDRSQEVKLHNHYQAHGYWGAY